jgi:hypothetical protein
LSEFGCFEVLNIFSSWRWIASNHCYQDNDNEHGMGLRWLRRRVPVPQELPHQRRIARIYNGS